MNQKKNANSSKGNAKRNKSAPIIRPRMPNNQTIHEEISSIQLVNSDILSLSLSSINFVMKSKSMTSQSSSNILSDLNNFDLNSNSNGNSNGEGYSSNIIINNMNEGYNMGENQEIEEEEEQEQDLKTMKENIKD